MTDDQFWALIYASRKQSTDCELQTRELQHLLFNYSAQEIIDFDRIFHQKLIESYRWDLWGIACLIQGHCSKQDFQNFCAWLIGQGQETYHQILDDPQSILTLVDEDEELLGCASLIHASSYAYDDVVGDEMPQNKLELPLTMKGTPLSEDDLSKQFPKIAEVFVR